MRSRKLSSIAFSFLVMGWSRAGCLGGGPMLGRWWPIVEFCLRRLFTFKVDAEPPTVELLARLRERVAEAWEAPWTARKLPDWRDRDWRVFVAEEAVCVVKLEGSWTGRVGDLGLGFTKPMPLGGKVWMLGGFLLTVSFGAEMAGVDFFSATVEVVVFLSAASLEAANLGAVGFDGLVGALTLRPVDLVAVFVVVFAVGIAFGKLLVVAVAFGAVLAVSLGALAALGIFDRMGMEDEAAAIVVAEATFGASAFSLEAPFAIRRRAAPFVRASGDFLGASDVALPVSRGLAKGFVNSFRTGDLSGGDASEFAGLLSLISFCSWLAVFSLLMTTVVGAEGWLPAGAAANGASIESLGLAPRAGFEIAARGVATLAGESETGVISPRVVEGTRFGVCATKIGRASSCLGLSSGTPAWDVVGVGTSPSVPALMVRDRVGMESLLVSRWRPTRPSFSTVTKFVRTRESGRGESATTQ